MREFFRRWITSGNDGDWDRMAGLLHDDVVVEDPMASHPVRGVRDALARVQAQYAPFPDGTIEMLGAPFVSVDEPELAYRWQFTGTSTRRIDPPGFAPTGLPVRLRGTSVLRFQDRRVIRVALFFDTTDVARQLLAAPPAGSRLEHAVAAAQRLRVRLRRTRGYR